MRHLSLLLVLLAAGCTIEDIDFSSDAISITAHTDGNSTTVDICAGSDGLLDCREDVVFTVTFGGTTVSPEPGLFGLLSADFPFDGSDEPVTVTHEDGLVSTVIIPPAFAINAPATAKRSDGVPTTWSPVDPESTMGWTINASCPSVGSFISSNAEVADDGSATIPSSDFGDLPNEVCTVSLMLERDRKGQISDAFPEGSRITGRQRRESADITLQP